MTILREAHALQARTLRRLEKVAPLNSGVCILEVDSPSYPPDVGEFVQCGCPSCIKRVQAEFTRVDHELFHARQKIASLTKLVEELTTRKDSGEA